MLSDIEIAQQTKMNPIGEVAASLAIADEDIECYGHYKAKLSESLFQKLADKPDGKLVLVTAINPTPAGEGNIFEAVTRKCKVTKTGERTFRIVITQGLNRQIRRMCEACNAKVVTLKRIRIMNIRLGDLKTGEVREVTDEELKGLLD